MLRKLTEEAWGLYLKILDVDRISGFSTEREDRIHRLTDQVYCRYVRRRDALSLTQLDGWLYNKQSAGKGLVSFFYEYSSTNPNQK